jgi:hypothetical protein
MPWTGVGVYVPGPGRFVVSGAGLGLEASAFTAVFPAGLFVTGPFGAAAFFFGAAFFGGGAAFFFMGRTLHEAPAGGQGGERDAPG